MVIYNTVAPVTSYWVSQTANKGAVKLCMQTTGNLVLFDANNVALWHSNTLFSGANLTVTNTGQLTIVQGGQVKFSFPGTISKCVSPATTTTLKY